MKKYSKQVGFTLAEILIALFIFAIVGTFSVLILHSVLNTHAHLDKATRQWKKLETVMILMQRDFTQVVDRPVIDKSGVGRTALDATQQIVSMTTLNNINPLQLQARSNLARVAYVYKDGQLQRETWSRLDGFDINHPQVRVLLSHVRNLQWQFIGAKTQSYSYWPADQDALPQAVIVHFSLPRLGQVTRIWIIPAKGGAHAPS